MIIELNDGIMKLKILTMLSILIIGFTACNSDRRNNGDGDSLMTDSAVMDTASMGTGTSDQSTVDTMGADTMKKDTIPPMR